MTPLFTPNDAVLLILVMSRIGAMFLSFPFIASTLLPHHIKIFMLLALSLYFIRILHLRIDISNFSIWWLLLMLFKEIFIGFALSLLVNFFIAAFAYAAEIISYFMGLTVVNIFDPTFGQVSVLSKYFIYIFYFLFFVTDAYHYFLSTIALSFSYIPLDLTFLDKGLWPFIFKESGYIFLLAFKLAFPFALILYLVNLALALVNRLIPQINVFIVGLPLQIFVGLGALALGASVIIYMGVSYLQRLGEDYIYLIKHLG